LDRTWTFSDRLFKAGDDAAFEAENLKELVPKGLLFGALASCAGPIAGEVDGVVADFVPTDRHGGGVCADKLRASMAVGSQGGQEKTPPETPLCDDALWR
jgi:hypothetical protein